ncbi:hypothetical protein IGI04_019547 [Brassica rapa subsp. trilocularis]|uniref:DUF641 domain-containing protein n=1 Tax=Brassica rapa subsp. trilocularis TaxID=1813537 RepID=A0ABQ7MG64_BRACM|nr:hypothetical protein IGI04_019547 [Brassica rapa subsp. trilocularis]
MSSSQGDKKDSDVEMGEATSPAPIPTSPAEVPACVAGHLFFREKLVRRQAEKELAQTGSEFPSSSAQVVTPCGTDVAAPLPQALPAGSSTTPILVEDKEKAADSMPPPPARKEIVLALRTPSAILATQPKSRKRKLAKSGDGETSQRGGSSLASGLRGKFISLIDGMISECGSETSRLSGELVELQGRWSETEAMLTAVEDSHSAKVAKLEVAIGELERDIGKTASSLLKEKKARKAKSSEVRRLQRQIESDAGLARRGIQEATDALRAEFQARLAKISASLGSLECIRSRDFALATIEGEMAVVRSFQSETSPTLEAEEARLSGCKGYMGAEDGDFDLILADLKSACFLLTCSEDPEGKDPMVGENGSDAAPGSDEAAVGRKVMSCRLISFFDCEMFHSRSVSRVLPRDVNSAGVLKVSNINIEAWFKNLLSFDIMSLRSSDLVAHAVVLNILHKIRVSVCIYICLFVTEVSFARKKQTFEASFATSRDAKVQRIPNLKSSPSCSSPRTPYILAPRSVYAFTLLPLSRHSIKMEIFHFSRSSQLSSKLPYLSAET